MGWGTMRWKRLFGCAPRRAASRLPVRNQAGTNKNKHLPTGYCASVVVLQQRLHPTLHLIFFLLARVCCIHAGPLNASSLSCANDNGGLKKGICGSPLISSYKRLSVVLTSFLQVTMYACIRNYFVAVLPPFRPRRRSQRCLMTFNGPPASYKDRD